MLKPGHLYSNPNFLKNLPQIKRPSTDGKITDLNNGFQPSVLTTNYYLIDLYIYKFT